MNGSDLVPLEQAGLLGRMFGRQPKADALRESQNLLAERSVDDLIATDVKTIFRDSMMPDLFTSLRNGIDPFDPASMPAEHWLKTVTLVFTSWNRIGQWLRHLDGLRQRPEPSAAARACAVGKRCAFVEPIASVQAL